MAVVIRLARHGRLHRPFYRVVAIDERCHREGKANEILGTFDPLIENGMKVDVERVHAWIKEGAQVSEALTAIFKKVGVALPVKPPTAPKKARAKKAVAKQDGKKFVPASRRAVQRHKKTVKAKAKAEAAAKAAAAPAPAAEAPTA